MNQKQYLESILIKLAPAMRPEAPKLTPRKRRTRWICDNGPCVHCGSTKKLEIDHVNPKYKTDEMNWGWNHAKRAIELLNCQVLCHNCHYQKSAKENDWVIEEGCHGVTRYRAGCRCVICRIAKSRYKKRKHQENKMRDN